MIVYNFDESESDEIGPLIPYEPLKPYISKKFLVGVFASLIICFIVVVGISYYLYKHPTCYSIIAHHSASFDPSSVSSIEIRNSYGNITVIASENKTIDMEWVSGHIKYLYGVEKNRVLKMESSIVESIECLMGNIFVYVPRTWTGDSILLKTMNGDISVDMETFSLGNVTISTENGQTILSIQSKTISINSDGNVTLSNIKASDLKLIASTSISIDYLEMIPKQNQTGNLTIISEMGAIHVEKVKAYSSTLDITMQTTDGDIYATIVNFGGRFQLETKGQLSSNGSLSSSLSQYHSQSGFVGSDKDHSLVDISSQTGNIKVNFLNE